MCPPPYYRFSGAPASDGRKLVSLVEQLLQVDCQMSIKLILLPDLFFANAFLLLFASCFYHRVLYRRFDDAASQDPHSSSSVRNVFLLYIFVTKVGS